MDYGLTILDLEPEGVSHGRTLGMRKLDRNDRKTVTKMTVSRC